MLKVDEEIIEGEKGRIVVEGKNVKRLRFIKIKGADIVIRDNNDIDEIWLENCNLGKFRNLSSAMIKIKNTKIRDGLIVDLSPKKTKRTTTATAPS